MKHAPLNNNELHILSITALRVLLAKNIINKEDMVADLTLQGIDFETAFRLKTAIDQMPNK